MLTEDSCEIKATTYDALLKANAEEVANIMEKLNSVHDGIQIHVNHFGRWVAKYKTQDATYYAFGHDLLTALTNLKDFPNKE